MEGLVCEANTGKSIAELGCSAAADLKARASGDGEHVPA